LLVLSTDLVSPLIIKIFIKQTNKTRKWSFAEK